MDIRHLRYFVAVAEHLNFSEAARKLSMSQPPLSQRIRELETQLGSPLFVREAGRIELSAEGEALLPRACHFLQKYDNTVATITRSSLAAREPLRVVNSAPIGSRAFLMIVEFLQTCETGHHQITNLSPSECWEAVSCGTADLAVGPIPCTEDFDIQAVALHREAVAVALPSGHPLTHSPKVSLVDLVGETWLLPSRADAPDLNRQFRLACRQIGMDPRMAGQLPSNLDHCLALVGLGQGVTLTCEAMIGASLAGVKVLPLHRPQITIEHRAIISRDAPPPLCAAFARLQERLRKTQMRTV